MIDSSSNNTYDVNESLKVENLTRDDYEEICKRLGRKPNRTELGTVSYTHLTLPTILLV